MPTLRYLCTVTCERSTFQVCDTFRAVRSFNIAKFVNASKIPGDALKVALMPDLRVSLSKLLKNSRQKGSNTYRSGGGNVKQTRLRRLRRKKGERERRKGEPGCRNERGRPCAQPPQSTPKIQSSCGRGGPRNARSKHAALLSIRLTCNPLCSSVGRSDARSLPPFGRYGACYGCE